MDPIDNWGAFQSGLHGQEPTEADLATSEQLKQVDLSNDQRRCFENQGIFPRRSPVGISDATKKSWDNRGCFGLTIVNTSQKIQIKYRLFVCNIFIMCFFQLETGIRKW